MNLNNKRNNLGLKRFFIFRNCIICHEAWSRNFIFFFLFKNKEYVCYYISPKMIVIIYRDFVKSMLQNVILIEITTEIKPKAVQN